MEKLKLKHEIASKALNSLEQVLIDYDRSENEFIFTNIDKKTIREYLRDSLIQRFEYCFDSVWKVLKIYLEVDYGIHFDIVSPKTVFRKALNAGIATEKQVRLALEMTDDRNKTSHLYNESEAKKISMHIKSYFELMKELMGIISDYIG